MDRRQKQPRIDGIYELGHVLYALDADSHGFSRADIAKVECYWTFGDMHSSSAGFVLALRDGRRAYVDFQHWHAFEQDEDFRIQVSPLPSGQRLPMLARIQEPIGGWSSETAHLERRLAG
jgi:hypothetical protein